MPKRSVLCHIVYWVQNFVTWLYDNAFGIFPSIWARLAFWFLVCYDKQAMNAALAVRSCLLLFVVAMSMRVCLQIHQLLWRHAVWPISVLWWWNQRRWWHLASLYSPWLSKTRRIICSWRHTWQYSAAIQHGSRSELWFKAHSDSSVVWSAWSGGVIDCWAWHLLSRSCEHWPR